MDNCDYYKIFNHIKTRAYYISLENVESSAFDNWLQAEQEYFNKPIWCLHESCLEYVIPFINLLDLKTHFNTFHT